MPSEQSGYRSSLSVQNSRRKPLCFCLDFLIFGSAAVHLKDVFTFLSNIFSFWQERCLGYLSVLLLGMEADLLFLNVINYTYVQILARWNIFSLSLWDLQNMTVQVLMFIIPMSRICLPCIIWFLVYLFACLFPSGLLGHKSALGFSWTRFKKCSLYLGLEKGKNVVYGSWSHG